MKMMPIMGTAASYGKYKAAQFEMTSRINAPNIYKQDKVDRVILKNAHGSYALPTPEEAQKERERQYISDTTLGLETKLKCGERLTDEELEFLKENSPELYEKAVKVLAERESYRKAIESCRTKEDVAAVHSRRVQGFFNETQNVQRMDIGINKKRELAEFIGMKLAGVMAEYREYTNTDEYKELPLNSTVIQQA